MRRPADSAPVTLTPSAVDRSTKTRILLYITTEVSKASPFSVRRLLIASQSSHPSIAIHTIHTKSNYPQMDKRINAYLNCDFWWQNMKEKRHEGASEISKRFR
jgi:hypothetical protein